MEEILSKIKLSRVEPSIVVKEIGNFIVNKILSANKKGAVLGLSGGIDSTLVAYLTKKAFDDYNSNISESDKLKIYGLMLPSKSNKQLDSDLGIDVVKKLNIDYEIINIEPIAEVFIKVLDGKVSAEYSRGNLSSEIRAIILSRVAAFTNSLILGTGNRDEDYCLGYFTKRGDGQVDISPIGELSKRQVREVATYIGVPDYIVNRTPTAGLWKGQTDEDELGFSYLEAEIIMAGKDQGYSREELKKITNFGYIRKKGEGDVFIVDKVLDMHEKNKFKTELPPVAKITKIF